MAILRSSHKAGKAKSHPKSFKELVSQLGQRTQLAAPKYADSTKLITESAWGHWTQYVPLLGSSLSSTLFTHRKLTSIHPKMESSLSGMRMVLTNSHDIPLYSTAWTPHSAGAYARTCISLIVVALVRRCLFALKTVREQNWRARAQSRRYVLVRGKITEAGKIEDDSDAKEWILGNYSWR